MFNHEGLATIWVLGPALIADAAMRVRRTPFPQAPRETCRKRNEGDEEERSAADVCDAHSNATRCRRRQTLDQDREHQRKNESRCHPDCARDECSGETNDDSLCVRHRE
jgi:hypothetical protein